MIFTLPVDIYKTFIIVAIEPTEEEWHEYCSQRPDLTVTEEDEELLLEEIRNPDGLGGCTIEPDAGFFIIFVRKRQNHGDIAHEIFHTVQDIMKRCKVPLTEDGESWAYLIGMITDIVYQSFYADLMKEMMGKFSKKRK
jgi:hypothetical protein